MQFQQVMTSNISKIIIFQIIPMKFKEYGPISAIPNESGEPTRIEAFVKGFMVPCTGLIL